MTSRPCRSPRRALWPALLTVLCLSACAAASAEREPWPPGWQDTPSILATDFSPVAFQAPSADHCRRTPALREVTGDRAQVGPAGRGREMELRARGKSDVASPSMAAEDRARDEAKRSVAPPSAQPSAPPAAQIAPSPWPRPESRPAPRPAQEPVTAGMVDDNADFGTYLAYRQRRGVLPVRDRDISERYLLEVSDAQGRPVHDAEVAVQRPGVAQPVMWARTDTAGRVWIHPRAFLPPDLEARERSLGVAVRHGGQQGRAVLTRGQPNSVQVRLGVVSAAPMRLDLVFLVDATGSMGDEIAKLKVSMRTMAQQIAQLPGQPDICWGLVAYRDRGDAYITRTYDFTDTLAGFQQQLASVQAHGGGDMPEALNEALHEVVHGLSWRTQAARLVVLVGDAPPHLDYGGCVTTSVAGGGSPSWGLRADGSGQPGACPQYDRDMQAALAKGIKLFAVGASGLDPVGEYIYRQMAQYTAGRFVFLTYQDAARPGNGPGTQTTHDVTQYSVQTLDRLVVTLVADELAKLTR